MDESIEAREDAWLRRNPTHPGHAILDGCIGPEAADRGGARHVSEAAARLGVDRRGLSRVIRGQCGITPALALKLESVGWGSAKSWLWRQASYDLDKARRRAERKQDEAGQARQEPVETA